VTLAEAALAASGAHNNGGYVVDLAAMGLTDARDRIAAVQRNQPVTSRRFRSASATKIWCRSAVVRVGRQTTRSGHPTAEIDGGKAVIRGRSGSRVNANGHQLEVERA